MKIPITWRKKALIIVDVTECFILNRNKYIVPEINKIINNIDYDLFVSCIPYNKQWSLRTEQRWWYDLLDNTDSLESSIEETLIGKEHITINKLSKSAFKWDIKLENILKDKWIEEVHIVWFESNDCVMATVFEAFDLWFYSFVIEEACETWSTESNHKHAIPILEYLNLTNNSKFVGYEKTEFKEI
jgi:nicotinamidase-related amidase